MQRPLLAGFHPDPSICRVDDHFYLVTSSFEYVPGVPIYRSTDLRQWELLGHVLDRPSQLCVNDAPPSGGIYAPTLRYHDGRFWMITTNVSDGGGHLLVHASDPAGPWSDPVRLPSLTGIDPDLAWDAESGRCLVTYSGYREHRPIGIMQAVIDPHTGEVLHGPALISNGSGGQYPEAPHLYQIGSTWYLLLAEGGTERGHMATIARGPTPSGPFEAFAGNPILTGRSTDAAVQGTGHGDLVQRADGSWAIVYLGTRPRGGNAGFSPLGREVFAREVAWRDGWPVLGDAIEPAAVAAVITDDGIGGDVTPVWIAPNRDPGELVERTGQGWQITEGLVARRQQHASIRVSATLAAGAGTGGLTLRIDPHHHYDLERDGGHLRAVAWIGGARCVLGEHALGISDVTLVLRTEPDTSSRARLFHGPDVVVLGYVDQGVDIELARIDGRYVTSEVAGGFTGRVVGVYARAGSILVQRWQYAELR